MTTKGLETYSVRPMNPGEVENVFAIIDKEGWKLTLDKFRMLYEAHPDKFYVAVSDNGELAGTVSLYPTFEGEYAVGNVVIKEGHRKKGLGRKLMKTIVQANPDAVMSLTAVVGADQFYLNIGFQLANPQQGHDIFHMKLNVNTLDSNANDLAIDNSIVVEQYCEKLFDDLVAFNQQVKGYEDKSYVEMQVKCYSVMVALNSEGKILGFGVAFLKNQEIIMDGLYADSDAIALILVRDILKKFSSTNNIKFQVHSSKTFLSTLGEVKSSYHFNRYCIGPRPLTPASVDKVYNVGDCDYSY